MKNKVQTEIKEGFSKSPLENILGWKKSHIGYERLCAPTLNMLLEIKHEFGVSLRNITPAVIDESGNVIVPNLRKLLGILSGNRYKLTESQKSEEISVDELQEILAVINEVLGGSWKIPSGYDPKDTHQPKDDEKNESALCRAIVDIACATGWTMDYIGNHLDIYQIYSIWENLPNRGSLCARLCQYTDGDRYSTRTYFDANGIIHHRIDLTDALSD